MSRKSSSPRNPKEHRAAPEPSRDVTHRPRVESKTRVKPLQDGTDPTEGGKYCGSGLRGKPGRHCRQPAGAGTDHLGEGRCKLHGGLTPIRHGRYSSLTTRPRLRELLDRLEGDPDPLNLLPELQLLRALVLDFIERYDEMSQALIAWHLSFDKEFQSDWADWLEDERFRLLDGGAPDDGGAEDMPDPMSYLPKRPLQIVDIAAASSIAAQIGQMVDRINKLREDKTFSMTTIGRLYEAMGADLEQSAREVITDDGIRETLLDTVEQRWKLIQLSSLTGARPRGGAD
ncbi:hypothetical protein [Deinococcus sp. NW-56]|uniref:hypothetical protein n=1 Tax=Deinococcus sp. NW-56 TaxID=2080419 RepID=UPI001319C186|nr:hypothetical protein [Deinococcus sp. NW-56]